MHRHALHARRLRDAERPSDPYYDFGKVITYFDKEMQSWDPAYFSLRTLTHMTD